MVAFLPHLQHEGDQLLLSILPRAHGIQAPVFAPLDGLWLSPGATCLGTHRDRPGTRCSSATCNQVQAGAG